MANRFKGDPRMERMYQASLAHFRDDLGIEIPTAGAQQQQQQQQNSGSDRELLANARDATRKQAAENERLREEINTLKEQKEVLEALVRERDSGELGHGGGNEQPSKGKGKEVIQVHGQQQDSGAMENTLSAGIETAMAENIALQNELRDIKYKRDNDKVARDEEVKQKSKQPEDILDAEEAARSPQAFEAPPHEMFHELMDMFDKVTNIDATAAGEATKKDIRQFENIFGHLEDLAEELTGDDDQGLAKAPWDEWPVGHQHVESLKMYFKRIMASRK